MLLAMLLLGVEPAEVAGHAGWVGSSLLGGVLYWLLCHHLPAKDKLLKEFIQAAADERKSQLETHTAQIKSDRAEYQISLTRVTEHCEKELSAITNGLLEQLRSIRAEVVEQREESREEHKETRHATNNIAHAIQLKLATGEIEHKPKRV